jgi:hypothetical protein
MSSNSSIHAYLNWAKERIDEMDAALASLESKAGEVQADARGKAAQLRAQLTKKRDDFRAAVEKQAEANEAAWTRAKAQLESDWSVFEAELLRNMWTASPPRSSNSRRPSRSRLTHR